MTKGQQFTSDPRNLEAFRQSEDLTYEQLADLINVSTARQAHRYAVGEQMPRPKKVLEIIRLTQGRVTAMALIDQCVEYKGGKKGRNNHPTSLNDAGSGVTEAPHA